MEVCTEWMHAGIIVCGRFAGLGCLLGCFFVVLDLLVGLVLCSWEAGWVCVYRCFVFGVVSCGVCCGLATLLEGLGSAIR